MESTGGLNLQQDLKHLADGRELDLGANVYWTDEVKIKISGVLRMLVIFYRKINTSMSSRLSKALAKVLTVK